MHDRVGTLALRVRTDLAGREVAVRDLAERFTRDVIERTSLLLEVRHPGRVVLLKTLPVAWTLSERESASSDALHAVIECAAEELALQIESALPAPALAFAPTDEIAVFADEIAFVASVVLARVRGTRAWYHERALRDDPFERLIREPDLALAVVAQLCEQEHLAEVVTAMPGGVRERLADALLGDARATVAPRSDDATVVLALLEQLAAWPVRERSALRIAATAFARVTAHATGLAIERERIQSWARRAIAVIPREPLPATISTPPAEPTPAPGDDPHTAYAGLFYLLPVVQELGIAEALWRACLAEGVAIVHAFAALVPGDDPALDVIAGAARTAFTVTDDQVRELACETLAAEIATLPRGGRAELPDGHVGFVDGPRGRLLLVTACDAAFVMFAWPAATPPAALAGLAALLARWPATTPLYGTPAVIELDRSGRIRYARTRPPAPFLVDSPTCAGVALASNIVGATCQVVVSRVGDLVEDVATWVARRLAVAGRIVSVEDAIEVWIDADAVDLELRAAGIDRDPGFVPWLATTIRLRFEA